MDGDTRAQQALKTYVFMLPVQKRPNFGGIKAQQALNLEILDKGI